MEDHPSPMSGGVNKAVRIAGPGSGSPMLPPAALDVDDSGNDSQSQGLKLHAAILGTHYSGRNTSTISIGSQGSFATSARPDMLAPNEATNEHHHHSSPDHSQGSSRLISQVTNWLNEEKSKRLRKAKVRVDTGKGNDEEGILAGLVGQGDGPSENSAKHLRRASAASDGGLALDKLEQILTQHMILDAEVQRPSSNSRGSHTSRRPSSIRKLRRASTAASSDTDYIDGDALVPSAEVVLDNSKTMSYTGGSADAESTLDLAPHGKHNAKEKEGWLIFKNEIVRLAHTLRLKGWRRVPLDHGGDIDVERLSGALTNAVYVVSPPENLPQTISKGTTSSTFLATNKPPPKLLLRIYGPQVEHLIDRQNELSILRRLARKKIGPRLLGTFLNGRFEEFFHAQTLTTHDLRVSETSKNIAKRMRELHEGIELLQAERDAGPFVWRNWDKWVARCEEVIKWVDHQILSGKAGDPISRGEGWKKRGLVCGVEWSAFRATVDKYRKWLDQQYGGREGIKKQLVFAHNDTQYGNILRLMPSGESPLLLPANEHKQLVVIDFEYASANTPGLEFANHFSEWCYNYHDPEKSYACNHKAYPTIDEQRRFIKSYINHRPQFNIRPSTTPLVTPGATPSVTPGTVASPGPTSSVSTFILDSRAPPSSFLEDEKRREEETELEIKHLMHEVRLWRVANSAQWVAWGIVQAKVDGMDAALHPEQISATKDEGEEHSAPYLASDPLSPENALLAEAARNKRPEGLVAEALPDGNEMPHEKDDEEEFDYLAYAQERAMFFWGDVLELGIVKSEELPAELLAKIKVVDY